MKRIWLFCLMVLLMCGCEKQVEAVNEKVESEQGANMSVYDFSEFGNVDITGCDANSLSETEQAILYTQARYCQAMTDADIETMREIVSEDRIFTHMSGKTQSREEYFADIERGRLNYFTIGIENPVKRECPMRGRWLIAVLLTACLMLAGCGKANSSVPENGTITAQDKLRQSHRIQRAKILQKMSRSNQNHRQVLQIPTASRKNPPIGL